MFECFRIQVYFYTFSSVPIPTTRPTSTLSAPSSSPSYDPPHCHKCNEAVSTSAHYSTYCGGGIRFCFTSTRLIRPYVVPGLPRLPVSQTNIFANGFPQLYASLPLVLLYNTFLIPSRQLEGPVFHVVTTSTSPANCMNTPVAKTCLVLYSLEMSITPKFKGERND